MTSLEERVAQALYEAGVEDKAVIAPWERTLPEVKAACTGMARAAIAVCAEEMARIADEQADENDTGEGWLTGKSIAAAIRSMGERG